MAVDVGASFFGCKEDVFRLEVPIRDKSLLVKELKAIGHLLEDKLCDSLVHVDAVSGTKIFELLFLCQLLG